MQHCRPRRQKECFDSKCRCVLQQTMAFQVDCADDNSWQKERSLVILSNGWGTMTGLSRIMLPAAGHPADTRHPACCRGLPGEAPPKIARSRIHVSSMMLPPAGLVWPLQSQCVHTEKVGPSDWLLHGCQGSQQLPRQLSLFLRCRLFFDLGDRPLKMWTANCNKISALSKFRGRCEPAFLFIKVGLPPAPRLLGAAVESALNTCLRR